ncbi:PREDICTED: uncharacterized protein LOC109356167 [Lupinus angustifolius]|uniref:uncharacterized protein LOC109356167 n=1 Tax=Lupinus angustifolius TaxID=3871 RepID=UPI00092E89A3|nr:PREDICTED: uncharacterized protein LOC109356167 [Lupinus angustifolius]
MTEDVFWKEKSRLNWHALGDRNIAFFHKVTKIRHATKSISMLKDGNNTISTQDDITAHVLNFYIDLFASPNNTYSNNLIQYVIPNLVTEDNNNMLTKTPSNEEIKTAAFDMNGDGAPGPDEFGGCFFQSFWELVYNEVCNSVRQFFTQSWLMPNLNSNNVIQIPKNKGAGKIEEFRPLALANFQFKIITKVFADRLATIAPKIISNEQMSFIKDRNIQDCICLASEAINLMDHKTFGGNLAIKLDIKKDFDTMDWNFIIDTLKAFGFNHKFINCRRRGKKMELLCLKNLIKEYATASGQQINLAKCKFYTSNSNPRRIATLSAYLSFSVGCLPFNYLGVPLFKGKPKNIHLQQIADRITSKLATWKGSFLSIMGRVELVRPIIQSMIVYSFHIYKWHVQFLNDMDKSIRNCIWAGDVGTRKMVNVAWHKVCYPLNEGGLGIRSIKNMNTASLLKLA